MSELPIAHITITRTLTEDDDLVDYTLSDGLSVLEAVGLLTMTIDSILTVGTSTEDDELDDESADDGDDEDDDEEFGDEGDEFGDKR